MMFCTPVPVPRNEMGTPPMTHTLRANDDHVDSVKIVGHARAVARYCLQQRQERERRVFDG